MPTLQLIPNRCLVPVVCLIIRGVKQNFIVDTGATSSCITPDILPALREVQTRRRAHCTASGERVYNYDVKLDFRFAGVCLSYINVSDVGWHMTDTLGIPISGLIGQDLLRKFSRVVIDYRCNTIEFVV